PSTPARVLHLGRSRRTGAMLSARHRAELEAWAREVTPRALAYARGLLREPVRAEDVVQECLLRLFRPVPAYGLPHDGVKLLFRAVSRLCLNENVRRRSLVSLSCDFPVVDPSDRPPEEVLIGRELERAVADALAELPPMQRAAVELRALGQSKEEI